MATKDIIEIIVLAVCAIGWMSIPIIIVHCGGNYIPPPKPHPKKEQE